MNDSYLSMYQIFPKCDSFMNLKYVLLRLIKKKNQVLSKNEDIIQHLSFN